jgi:hypothetical protein
LVLPFQSMSGDRENKYFADGNVGKTSSPRGGSSHSHCCS